MERRRRVGTGNQVSASAPMSGIDEGRKPVHSVLLASHPDQQRTIELDQRYATYVCMYVCIHVRTYIQGGYLMFPHPSIIHGIVGALCVASG